MAESHTDSDEIEELANVYSSPSYSPSTDGLHSDSDSSCYKSNRKISNCHECSSPKKIDESSSPNLESNRKISNCNESSSPRKIDESNSLYLEILKCLDDLRVIRDSSDVKSDFLRFCRTFIANHFEPTPEQRKNAKTLDIEIDECNFFQDQTDNEFAKQSDSVIIEENWNCFCEDYGFDPKKDLKLFYFGSGIKPAVCGKQRVLFKRYLSLHLPYRLDFVYHKFLKKFFFRRSTEKFFAEEDELLTLWCEISETTADSTGFSVLSLILQRRPQSLEYRLTVLNVDGINKNFAKPFFRLRKSRSQGLHYLDDILTRQADEYPDWIMDERAWKEMVDIDGQSSVWDIKKTYFLELYPSAKAIQKLSSTRFKRHLIWQMSSLEQPTWETVDWKELGKRCFNVGAVRVYSVMRMLVKKHVPAEKWGDLNAALKILREYYRLPEKRSRRVSYKGDADSKTSILDPQCGILLPGYLDDILTRQADEYPDWIMNEQAWKEMVDIDGQSSVRDIKKTYFQELYPSAKAIQKHSSARFKRHLIKQISLLEQPTWETVDWKELGKNCFNVGAVRVYSVIRMLVRNHVHHENYNDLDAALKTIREYYKLPTVSRESGGQQMDNGGAQQIKNADATLAIPNMDGSDADIEESPIVTLLRQIASRRNSKLS